MIQYFKNLNNTGGKMHNIIKLTILAVLLAVSAAALTGENSNVPNSLWYINGTLYANYNCSGHLDGNYPHPEKCTHYIACVGGKTAYEMICALNQDGKPLHYVPTSGPNPTKSRCDYPKVAGCKIDGGSVIPTSGPTKPDSPKSPEYPANSEPSVNDEPPATTTWYSNGSIYANYNCSGHVDGNYPHPEKCTHYIACVGGTTAYEMTCALNQDGKPLHYVPSSGPNPATSRCDYPNVAGCKLGTSGTSPTSNPNGSTPSSPDKPEKTGPATTTWYSNGTIYANYNCTGRVDGNYPHPEKCTHYIACVGGKTAYEMICALNQDGKPLHYVPTSGPNPVTSRCDYPKVAGCKLGASGTEGTGDDSSFTPSKSNSATPNTPENPESSGPATTTWFSSGTIYANYNCSGHVDGNYPHPKKCTHYIACVGGTTAYEMICALNQDGKPLHYVPTSGPNPITSRCDRPKVAGCKLENV